MYITGVGITKFGKRTESLKELMLEAMLDALADAKLEINDIDAVYISNNLSALTHNQSHLGAVLASYLPDMLLPIYSLEAACGGGGVAIHQACISLKHYERILVIGVEKMSEAESVDMLYYVASDADRELDQSQGLVFPAAGALAATQYMQRYDATLDDLTLVSLKNHHNGNLNPKAHFYGKEVTREMIESSRVICSPLRLYDCSANTDGAAAVVLERERRGQRAVEIVGSSFATNHINFAQEQDVLDLKVVQKVAKDAFAQAGVQHTDINVCEIHDGFNIVELIMFENLGFCAPGEAKDWVRTGRTDLDGELPVNPSGGLKACGHPVGATGVRQVGEIVIQLRGEAGERQVKDARVGLAYNFGSLVGSAVVHILRY
jgi:acetyl-CoA C-acetyltransferase